MKIVYKKNKNITTSVRPHSSCNVVEMIWGAIVKRKVLVFSLLFLLVTLPIVYLVIKYQSPIQAAWFDDTFAYRQTVAITNAGTAQTDFQVAITLNTSALVTAGKLQSDCDDIRITDVGGKVLPHWIETGTNACNTTTTAIWTKVPSISTTGTTVFVYYGNPSATSVQNGNNAFLFFDDFSSSSIDSAKWTSTTGSPSISSGKLVLDATEGLFAGNYAIPANTVWVSLTDPQTTTGTGGAIRASTTTGTGWVNDGGANIVDILLWYGNLYSETNSGESLLGAYATGFKKYKITYRVSDADSVAYDYNDGALTSTRTGSNAAGTLHPVMYSSIRQSQYDWFFIRKTATTEPAVASPTNEEKSQGPVAYWKFDEGYGVTANNSTSVTGINGTISGATWQTEDQCISGKCLYFTSTNNINIADPINNSLDFGTGDFTISTWIKTGNSADNRNLFRKGVGNGLSGWRFGLQNGVPDILIGDTVGFSNGNLGSTSIADNKWHHLSVVYDRDSNATGYVDGKNVGTVSISTRSGSVDNASAIIIGNSYESFIGYLDEPKIYPYARTAAQIKSDFKSRGTSKGTSAALGASKDNLDALSNGLVGYWKMDESATPSVDSSGNGQNGIWTGNATSAAGKFGNAISLDGTGDYVSITDPGTSPLDLPGAWSISAWTFVNTTETGYGHIVGKRGTGDNYTFRTNGSGASWECYFDRSGWQGAWGIGTVHKNAWHYLTCTYDGINTIKIYEDGQEIGSASVGTPPTPDNNPVEIGSWTGGNEALDGKLDDVRIYNRALSPKEVRDLYAWAPGPVGYWKMDEKTGVTAYDSSGNGNTTTSWGSDPAWASGKFGSGVEFDGDDYMEITANSNFNVRALTIESWIKTPSTMGGTVYRALFSKQGADRDYNFYTYSSDGTNVTHLHFSSARWTTGNPLQALPTGFSPNTWHHVAVTVDASNLKFYADGVNFYTTSSTDAYANNSYNVWISRADNYWNGIQDEVKIYNYARTQKQIVEDMNAGHPAGGSPVGSQVGYWKFDEGYGTTANNSGNGGTTYNVTLASSPNIPTWTNEGKFGKALSFDGSNDYATINTSLPTLTEGTLSMWVKRTATTGTYQMLFTDASSQFEMAWNNATNLQFYVNNVAVNTSTAASLNIWYHITGTFSETGNFQRIYVNGVLANSSTYPGDATTATRYFGSRAGSYPFAGSIDEIKVYNSALTEDEIKLDYNHGSAMVLGSLSTDSTGAVADNSSAREYCIPGDTTSCSAPVGEWKMDEKTGTNAYDTSGNGNTGTLAGNPVWRSAGECKVGACLTLDRVDDRMTVNHSASLEPASITVEAWIKLNDFGDRHILITKWLGYSFEISTARYPYFRLNGISPTDLYSSQAITWGKWHHIAATLDNTTKQRRIYLDGVNTGSETVTGSISYNQAGLAIPYSSATWASGAIDQVKIYDYARTAAQIAWDYNRGRPVGWWKLDECQGIVAYDSAAALSGAGNDGTITIGATGSQTSPGTCTDGLSTSAWYNGVTGKYNSSLNFDGVDDYVDNISDSSYRFSSGDFTLSSWIKQTSGLTIIGKGADCSASGSEYVWQVNGSGFYFRGAWRTSSALNISTGTWINQTIVFTDSDDVIKIYNNGVLAGTITGVTGTYATSTGYLRIAKQQTCGNYFNGQIDDVRVFNYALTANQIKTLFNNGSVNFGPSTGSP